jgi:hypothetical protein
MQPLIRLKTLKQVTYLPYGARKLLHSSRSPEATPNATSPQHSN